MFEQRRLEVGGSPAHCLISRVSFSSSLGRRVPKERACHCLLSAVRVNNKQWKDSGVASSSPYCCHFGNSNTPPCSSQPPLTTHSLSTPLNLCHLPRSDLSPKTPEGRSPSQPTLPSKKPREGVVPPGTGKPFILGSSLLTDSCVDWKVGGMLYGPRLHQPCGLSVPDLLPPPPPSGPPAPQPTTSSNAPIATHSHPPTHSNQPSSPLYFCLCFNPATYHPAFSLKLKNRHCFTVTFSWCFVRADHLGLFYDKCVSHVLFRDLLSWEYTKRREDNKEKDKEAERDRADSVQTLSQTYSICCIYICTCTYKIKKKFEATCLCIGNRDYLIWLEHQLQTRHYPSSYFHYNTGKG